MDTTKKIQESIQSELAKEQPSFSKLANLYDGLADTEEGKIRFSVEASHINRLGLELVGRRETALSELIKNAYDADATQVDVLLEDCSSVGGTMTITDNGEGMSREAIRFAWMRLSTSSKAGQIESPGFGRPRAGRKGIGRFATQRLGTQLVLETSVAGSTVGSRATFNWDEDYIEGRSLSTIWTDIEEFDCSEGESGTKLIIHALRDAWSDANLRRVWKSILFLQPPFPLADRYGDHSVEDEKPQSDPGFHVEINGSDKGGTTVIASLENDLLQYALAEITAEIDKDGAAVFRLYSKTLDASEEFISNQKFWLTGPLKLQARYFIFGGKSVPGISAKLALQIGDEFGGIRIHRNSFRVSPYGEPHNDWLGLDMDVARRAILPAANNRNFFGHVEIDETENPLLEETSSREGLVENEAHDELRVFARSALEWAVLRIAAIRGRKQTATQKGFVVPEKKASEVVESSFSELIETVDEMDSGFSDDASRKKMQTAISMLKTNIVNVVHNTERMHQEERVRNIQYESMLRVLASLGLSISVFGHEIKSATSLSSGTFSVLKLRIEKVAAELLRANLNESADKLQLAVKRVFDLGGYIEDLTSYTATRKMMPVPVLGSIERFTNQFSSYLDRYSVEFHSDVQPKGLRTCEMHSSEFDSVLFNLLTNSMKAFQRAGTKQPKVLIEARREDGLVVVRFQDNGHEISAADQDQIFDAFYTTTEFSSDDIAGPGTGLGLKIVSDIAESYGGSIQLSPPSAGYITCFQVAFRANSGSKKPGTKK